MKKISIILLLALVSAVTASAQGRGGLRINEIMVQNDSNYVDDYGQHGAWIELFNSTFAPMEISSVYLTNDPANPKKYPVPLGDVNTEIPGRQHVVFWADAHPTRGTFHLNFALTPGQDNWIGLYDANGITLIDEVVIPASLPAGASYARKVDGIGTGAEAWEVRDESTELLYITPSSNNFINDSNGKVEQFAQYDEHGFALTLMGVSIVFSALLVLCICFYIISKIGARTLAANKTKTHGTQATAQGAAHGGHDSGEEIAAIVMALAEHLDAHDQENTILTINKVKRAYSPWSSKIYNMRSTPRH